MDTQDKPATVLIVDDAPTNLSILTQSLRTEFDVHIATGGREALRLIDEIPPDLVLLDILMPEMDGHEVCRRLKSNPATSNIPVIFLTAKGDVADETLGLAIGAVDYIVKPVNIPIVQARVRTHVELKRRGDRLETLSLCDGLTGIANRRRFDDALSRAWRKSMRSNTPISLVMSDIDYFKAYNDTYGHLAGDECLKSVARVLAGSLKRPGDMAARFGGEEFTVILEETSLSGASHVAECMRQGVANLNLKHRASTAAPVVTISLGVATGLPRPGQSVDALLRLADYKLYEAKQAGRNRIMVGSVL